MSHESRGKSDEWYTPKYVFDALGVEFDLDVASPVDRTFVTVPANKYITSDSLSKEWDGFVWMNPPFGDSKNKEQWLLKFIEHGNGVALVPDRTSASWWHLVSSKTDAVLFFNGRVKFIKPDGTIGEQPSTGTTLFAIGEKAVEALKNAEKKGLGKMYLNTQS